MRELRKYSFDFWKGDIQDHDDESENQMDAFVEWLPSSDGGAWSAMRCRSGRAILEVETLLQLPHRGRE
jgi:hypothetical protein